MAQAAIILAAIILIGAVALLAHIDVHKLRARGWRMPADDRPGGCRVKRVQLADGSNFFADVRGQR